MRNKRLIEKRFPVALAGHSHYLRRKNLTVFCNNEQRCEAKSPKLEEKFYGIMKSILKPKIPMLEKFNTIVKPRYETRKSKKKWLPIFLMKSFQNRTFAKEMTSIAINTQTMRVVSILGRVERNHK